MSLTYLGVIVAGSAVGTIGEFNVHTGCISSMYIDHCQQYRIIWPTKGITDDSVMQLTNESTKKSVKKSKIIGIPLSICSIGLKEKEISLNK